MTSNLGIEAPRPELKNHFMFIAKLLPPNGPMIQPIRVQNILSSPKWLKVVGFLCKKSNGIILLKGIKNKQNITVE